MTKHKSYPKPVNPNVYTDETGLERLIFFSDAVFAIAITLLALEIRLPPLPEIVSNTELLAALGSIWPKYLSFGISFLVIGSYWLLHHRTFRNIRRYDARLLSLNLLLLMGVSFIPFPTAVIGEHANLVGTVFYAAILMIVGILANLVWLYAYGGGGRLLEKPLSTQQFRHRLLRMWMAPAIFLLSIGVAFWDPDLAKYVWLLNLLISFLRRIQPD
jgi:uncharacterized membrane protein